jgi:hypothetical protein
MSAETEQYGYPFEAGAQELLDMSAEDLERQAAQAIYVGRHMMYQTGSSNFRGVIPFMLLISAVG